MLDRFQDDPVELNVHTEMQSMGFGPGRDMSVLIAENLDKMQKEYLTAAAQRTQSESFEMVQANQDQRFRSNKPRENEVAMSEAGQISMDPVKKGNWMDQNSNNQDWN